VIKSFVIGVLLGALLLTGAVYYYFASGMAPVATSDPPMPYEKKLAGKSLDAHMDKANIPAPPIAANEQNYLAGAKVYNDHCAWCHGLPNQPPPPIADNMYPHPTLLFKGKGVTDDPPQESYWKAANGIRLSGMPSFKNVLTDTELWQVALLVAHADEIPDSVKKILVPEPDATATVTEPPTVSPPHK
jgi:mono/diheme cytochrome c family protein